MEPGADLTSISAAMVNGEKFGVYQDCGDTSWLSPEDKGQFIKFSMLDEMLAGDNRYGICITYMDAQQWIKSSGKQVLVFHPPCLHVGIGCNRDTPTEEIKKAILDTFSRFNLSQQSIAALATIDIKNDEEGLLDFSEQRAWPLRTFSTEELAVVKDLPTPSEQAKKCVGVAGVAEPAALLSAGATDWLVTKQKYPNVTVAVALQKEGPWVS
jgi:hypothetical protein